MHRTGAGVGGAMSYEQAVDATPDTANTVDAADVAALCIHHALPPVDKPAHSPTSPADWSAVLAAMAAAQVQVIAVRQATSTLVQHAPAELSSTLLRLLADYARIVPPSPWEPRSSLH